MSTKSNLEATKSIINENLAKLGTIITPYTLFLGIYSLATENYLIYTAASSNLLFCGYEVIIV